MRAHGKMALRRHSRRRRDGIRHAGRLTKAPASDAPLTIRHPIRRAWRQHHAHSSHAESPTGKLVPYASWQLRESRMECYSRTLHRSSGRDGIAVRFEQQPRASFASLAEPSDVSERDAQLSIIGIFSPDEIMAGRLQCGCWLRGQLTRLHFG